MEHTENQRLKLLMPDLGFKTQASFAKALKLTPGAISDILRGKSGVGVSANTKRLLENSYNVNVAWLETGEGERFKTESKPVPERSISADVRSEDRIPMFNAGASASNIQVYDDESDSKIVGYISFPGITANSFAIQVHGSSMHPTLENGSWAVLRPIQDPQNIVWGEIYYIEFDDYRMFKRLLIGPDDQNVVLWSDNQDERINDQPVHSPVLLRKSDIRKLSLLTDIYKKRNH